ncbi:hypothetical protein Rsub_04948 [Raphidocelis subcapitata]|uniref:Uncharacterized protein n=1 Tax=Raphidocelis subcapitata TaxID=307507 RepID=A0A2V0P1X9_9CHLO|nr:hypothetical protein Rsub_04948 [Raphidocelis subcapitata]|eukprot:GBF91843.1 hypothetical protein Rsub_04948 [Raphidocelis subcapitata]
MALGEPTEAKRAKGSVTAFVSMQSAGDGAEKPPTQQQQQQQQKAAGAAGTSASVRPTLPHDCRVRMGGFYKVIKLEAGGEQPPCFGIGPGESKGGRGRRARDLAAEARSEGRDPESLPNPFEPGAELFPKPKPPQTPTEAGKHYPPLNEETLPIYAKVVRLQSGGAQSISYGISQGEHKGDRVWARNMSQARRDEPGEGAP